MSLKFNIDTQKGIQIARLSGKLIEASQADDFHEWIQEQIDAEQHHFIFDLSAMDYVNSIGINLFIRIFTKIRNKGGELIFINIPDKINQLLIITKLNTIFTIAESEKEAMNQIKK